jgi:hypothetical protein
MLLGSIQAGLRANAMAALTWAMVTEAPGQVTEGLHVLHAASITFIYMHDGLCTVCGSHRQ